MTISAGTRLGPYEVLSPLGAGGMGEVYRARDHKLKRDVAIKVLPPALASDPDALSRFEREALAVAALSHPNILSIFDFGVHDSVSYAVTELLEGETLRAKLDAGPISVRQAVGYALQVASGLSAAHEKGIVHRDLKPENLFVTREGHVKILDFGLARRTAGEKAEGDTSAPTGPKGTEPGTVMGTVGYMSPEQVKGLPVDHRSDIFSFGTVLYEMLTGKRIWKRDSSAETIAAILKEEPPDLSEFGRRIPPALEHIVTHCLEKQRDDRFQSARDIAFNLQEVSSGIFTSGSLYPPPPARRRPALLLTIAGAIVLVAVALFVLRRPPPGGVGLPGDQGASPTIPRQVYLAVLPFRNLTGKPEGELMGVGLAETVSVRLASLKGLQLVTPRAGADAAARDAPVQQAARKLGASHLLEGSLQHEKERFRITYRLLEASGAQVAASAFDGTELFELQDRVADHVARDLRLDHGSLRTSTPSGFATPADQELYLQAVGLLQRYDKREAVEQALGILHKLVAQRPQAALSRAALSRASLAMFDFTRERTWADRAAAEAETARKLDPALPEVDVTLGDTFLATGRAKEAMQAFRHALGTRPGYVEALLGLGRASEAAGDDPSAEAAFRQAIDLQPASFAGYNQLGALFADRGRYAEAAETFRRATRLVPDSYRAYSNLGGVLTLLCDFPGALEAFRRALDLRPDYSSAASNLGLTQLWTGHPEQAVESLERATASAPNDFMVWGNLADAYRATRGGEAKASRAFERSIALSRESLRLNPNSAAAFSNLATGLAKTGHPVEAIQPMRRALALDDKNPSVLADAATVAALGNRNSEALEWLRKAVAAGYCRQIVARQPEFAKLREQPEFRSIVAEPRATPPSPDKR